MFNRKKKKNKGFTLVELLVVIAIIGILAIVAVPTLFKNINKAKATDVVADVRAIKTAVMAEYADGSDISDLNGSTNNNQDDDNDIENKLDIQDFSGEGKYTLTTNENGDDADTPAFATLSVTVNSSDIAQRVAKQLGLEDSSVNDKTITVPILGTEPEQNN